MERTPNYDLAKPSYVDHWDVVEINKNTDIIDKTLAAKATTETGVFTLTFSDPNVTSVSNVATYSKTGKVITLNFTLAIESIGTMLSSAIIMYGLPLTNNQTRAYGNVTVRGGKLIPGFYSLGIYVQAGASQIHYICSNAGETKELTYGDLLIDGTFVEGTITYSTY